MSLSLFRTSITCINVGARGHEIPLKPSHLLCSHCGMPALNKYPDTSVDDVCPQGDILVPGMLDISHDIHEMGRDADAVSGPVSRFEEIRKIVLSFLCDISYTPMQIPRNRDLEEALMHIVRSWNVDDGHGGKFFETITKDAAAVTELSYYHHEFDLKIQLALFTCFGLYVDDLSARIPNALQSFQERLHQRLPQLDPVLAHFGPHLSDMYIYFEPSCANSMVSAALEFVNGCFWEVQKEVTEMPRKSAASEWPYYLRAKTGVAPVYGFGIFPRKKHPNMTAYIQAMADIAVYVNIINDVLSFYKEEVAGDKGNYIHNRSRTLGEDPIKVLADVAKETIAARDRVFATLEDEPEALAAWRTFDQGYTTFHMSQQRYRLGELDPSLAVELL